MPKVSLSDSQIDDLIEIVLEGSYAFIEGENPAVTLYARGRTIRDIQEYLEGD